LVYKVYNRSNYPEGIIYEAELRDRVKQIKLERTIRWMEEVQPAQLPEVYAFADIIINFPEMDAFPITFLEAAACEKQVITCRLPSYTGTFVEDYYKLVTPGDVSGLTEAMIDIVNSDNIELDRQSLLKAHNIVERCYTEQLYLTRLLTVYHQLIS
jgi:glycosyltransferase involved in cell wall biosynthesis